MVLLLRQLPNLTNQKLRDGIQLAYSVLLLIVLVSYLCFGFVSMFQAQKLSVEEKQPTSKHLRGSARFCQNPYAIQRLENVYNIHFDYPSPAEDWAKVLSVIQKEKKERNSEFSIIQREQFHICLLLKLITILALIKTCYENDQSKKCRDREQDNKKKKKVQAPKKEKETVDKTYGIDESLTS